MLTGAKIYAPRRAPATVLVCESATAALWLADIELDPEAAIHIYQPSDVRASVTLESHDDFVLVRRTGKAATLARKHMTIPDIGHCAGSEAPPAEGSVKDQTKA